MMRVTDWSNLNQTPIFLLRRRSHKASAPCPSRLVAPIRLRGWISSDGSCFEREGIDKSTRIVLHLTVPSRDDAVIASPKPAEVTH